MQSLIVTYIQTELVWENVQANLEMLDNKIKAIENPTDLIVLPEMFSTGFSMNPAGLAETMLGSAVTWMKEKAAEKAAVITGSLMIEEGGHYFNRLIWAQPNGRMRTYDKKHLFRMTGEEKVYQAGTHQLTVELKGWRIRPFICYDLRFPVWMRNSENPYDLAIVVANWPASREVQWQTLLRARAIENQSYVIGVNRVGVDGNEIDYNGYSCVIDYQGNVHFQEVNRAHTQTASLSLTTLQSYRKTFPVWMDRDRELDQLFHESNASV
jgi:predicted amidohydrolase